MKPKEDGLGAPYATTIAVDTGAGYATVIGVHPGDKTYQIGLRVIGAMRGELKGIAQVDKNAPIPMLLTCPACGERHIDEGDFATKAHHTHACQHCGMCWRPAVVATVGVRFLPGFKNGVSATGYQTAGEPR